jgi:hypothetical protein
MKNADLVLAEIEHLKDSSNVLMNRIFYKKVDDMMV